MPVCVGAGACIVNGVEQDQRLDLGAVADVEVGCGNAHGKRARSGTLEGERERP